MATKSSKPGSNRLAMNERFKLLRRLEDCLVLNEVDHTADYKSGHSDASIAQEFKLRPQQIAVHRREVFGNFSQHQKPADEKIAELENRIDQLFQSIVDLTARVDYMTDAPDMTNVAEIKKIA